MRTEVVEDEIKTGLRGSELDQFKAISRAHERYADALAAYVKEKIAPTLSPNELTEVIDSVFIGLASKARKGNFQADGSLVALLFRMARFRAKDKLGEKFKHEENNVTDRISVQSEDEQGAEELSSDEIVSIVASKLRHAPEIAAAWRVVTHEWTADRQTAAAEIVRQFKIWMASLPLLQRKVAESMAAHFGDITDPEICDEIARTQTRPTVASVKSARKQIREKFRTLMRIKERSGKNESR